MSVFFTSDLHLDHKNILKYSERPFLVEGETFDSYTVRSILNMNSKIVERWNSVVQPADTVYVLGDFSFARSDITGSYLDQMNGHKVLIRGNHDKPATCNLTQWASVHDYLEIMLDGQKIVMSHYPMEFWHDAQHGSLMLHGHSHGKTLGNTQRTDVGVDCWNYYPVSLDQIKQRLEQSEPFKLIWPKPGKTQTFLDTRNRHSPKDAGSPQKSTTG